jgi:hypothetical protein
MMRLKAYRWTDIGVGSYWISQEVQIISIVVEYLQGIQIAKVATVQCKNRLGNPAIVYGHFTRADDAYTKHNMYSKTV